MQSLLHRRLATISHECVLCGEVETVIHLYKDCHIVRHVWSLFNLAWVADVAGGSFKL